jgi:hypothetical protein
MDARPSTHEWKGTQRERLWITATLGWTGLDRVLLGDWAAGFVKMAAFILLFPLAVLWHVVDMLTLSCSGVVFNFSGWTGRWQGKVSVREWAAAWVVWIVVLVCVELLWEAWSTVRDMP